MEDCRETASPRYNSTDAHTHSQLLWQHTSDLYRFEPGRVPALRRVRRSGFLAQAKGYLNSSHWPKENQCSPLECTPQQVPRSGAVLFWRLCLTGLLYVSSYFCF